MRIAFRAPGGMGGAATSVVLDAASSVSPIAAEGAGRPSDSGTCRRATGTHTTASGRFSRNTHRHPGPSTSQPPRNGPTAAPMPPNPDHRPTARPRSSRWKEAWMSASEPGVRSAPPTPCNARAAISTPAFGASPHSSEAAANHTTPTTNTLRRP